MRKEAYVLKEVSLYDYLYQSVLTQLACGALRQGDRLPSQTELCRQYNVGITTVRRVYRMLQAEGVIDCEARTKAVIRCDLTNAEITRMIQNRKLYILDIYRSLAPLYPFLQAQGAFRIKELEPLRNLLRQSVQAEEQRGRLHCYSQLLETLFSPFNNQLLKDWHQEVSHVTYVPLYATLQLDPRVALPLEEFQQLFNELLEAMANSEISACEARLRQIYDKGWMRAEKILDALAPESEGQRKVPAYSWAALASRTPKYTAIACSLLERIRAGEFDDQRYIPSIPQLMQEYSASLATIRSAVAVLNDIGVIRTAAKKGSVIVSPSDFSLAPMKLDKAIVEENIVTFLDALQLLTLCWTPLVRVLFPKWTSAFRQALAERLEALPSSAGILAGELLRQLREGALYAGQRQFLTQLEDLLLWGHYLKRLPNLKLPDALLPERLCDDQRRIVQALKESEEAIFITLTQRLFDEAYAIARDLARQTEAEISRFPAALKKA